LFDFLNLTDYGRISGVVEEAENSDHEESSDGGVEMVMLFFLFLRKRTRDSAFVSLCYKRSGVEICTGYAMTASGRMQYNYKQTKQTSYIYPTEDFSIK